MTSQCALPLKYYQLDLHTENNPTEALTFRNVPAPTFTQLNVGDVVWFDKRAIKSLTSDGDMDTGDFPSRSLNPVVCLGFAGERLITWVISDSPKPSVFCNYRKR